MLTNRSWAIVFGVVLLQAGGMATAFGQVSIRERFTTGGTVEAVAAGLRGAHEWPALSPLRR